MFAVLVETHGDEVWPSSSVETADRVILFACLFDENMTVG